MQSPLEKPRNYLKCCQTSSLLIYTEVSKLGIKGLIVKSNGVRKNLLCRYLECKHMSLLFTDTCYVLSFAIIMLNTSLHNPNVRDKPGVDRFISMNRGINEGGDLPEELLRVRSTQHCFSLQMQTDVYSLFLCFSYLFLQNLYESIKNEPFKIPEDDGNDLTHTFFNPDREGWLLKLGMVFML